MKTIELKKFVDEMEREYTGARLEYESMFEQLKNAKLKYDTTVSDKYLNEEGKKKATDDYNVESKRIKKEIENIRNRFVTATDEVINREAEVFRKKYAVSPKDLDMMAVTILESGFLTENEVADMAVRYKQSGNNTMYRFACRHLDENSSDQSIRLLARDAYREVERPDTEIMNEFRDVCLRGLRDDIELSNGIHKRHEEFLTAVVEDSEGISVTLDE